MTDDRNIIACDDQIAIGNLITEFGWRVDHGQGDKVAELFLETGVVITPMFELKGRAAIDRQFTDRARAGGRISRHVWSNLRLTRLDDMRIKAETIVQTWIASGEPPKAAEDIVVGDSIDIVVKGDDGRWRFQERRLVIAFKGVA